MNSIDRIENLPYATYDDGQTLPMDLYLPSNVPRTMPVILWLPGGGWAQCNKATAPWFYAEFGFAIAAINYRVGDQHPAPANVHDCKAAVRWLRAHADEFGLDPQRIGVWGKSAGGHLALLLGLSGDLPGLEGTGGNPGVSSRVQAVCSFYGIGDVARVARPDVREHFATLYDVTCQYLGGPPEERAELARLLSPTTYVSRDAPPILLFHGDQDAVVPVEESILMHDALQRVGADVEFHVIPGAGHHWNLDITRDRLVTFFHRTLSRS